MRVRGVTAAVLALGWVMGGGFARAQEPPSVPQALAALADQPATHTAFSFDRSMLASAQGLFGQDSQARRVVAALNSISVDTYRYPQPAFYAPQTMGMIIAAYDAAGWKHLVNANVSPATSAQPGRPITDMWLHFRGAEIDDVTVLVRGPKDMNLIQVSCLLRPLDLMHLGGHFGIPKVDPDAVMVPAPPGR